MAKTKANPSDRELPGMEDVRFGALDRDCVAIGDIREQMNQLRADEAAAINRALKHMQHHERTVYKHRGVELVLVPGDVKLRVRTTSGGDIEQADAPEKKPRRAKKAKKAADEVTH